MNKYLSQEEENKKEIYKYIDLNNYSSYLKKIEKISEKKGDFSFKVLIDDLDKNVICNDKISGFKEDIKKILVQMENYFEKNILIMVELLNQSCLDKFYKLIENEINNLIINKNYDYYLFIKQDLYKKLSLIYNSYKKSKNVNLSEKQKCILDEFIRNLMKDYFIKLNVLKKYDYLNKEIISYEDLLYININNTNEIDKVIYTINENNKVYNTISLPPKIIIREMKEYNICYYKFKDINNIDQISRCNKLYDNGLQFTKMIANGMNTKNIYVYIDNMTIYSYIDEFEKYIYSNFVFLFNNIIDKYNIKKLIHFVKQGIGGFTSSRKSRYNNCF